MAQYVTHPMVANATEDGSNLVLGIWRSDEKGRPANGGTGVAVKSGDVQEIAGPLKVCTRKALHASIAPQEWDGDRWWVVAMYEPVEWNGAKFGSLKRLIVDEIR